MPTSIRWINFDATNNDFFEKLLQSWIFFYFINNFLLYFKWKHIFADENDHF